MAYIYMLVNFYLSLITAVDKNGYQEHAIKGAGGVSGQTAVTSVYDKIPMFDDDKYYKVQKSIYLKVN